jgi:predicted RNase H-like nuclease (RuvC/YqgF family)
LISKVDSNICKCNDSISNLRNDNANLLARIDKSNDSLASLRNENENLIAKAKDLDVCNVTISYLKSKNDILHAKIVELSSCKPLHLPLSMFPFVLDVEILMLMLFMIT